MRTCITPDKRFQYGIHKPQYNVQNLREKSQITELGHLQSAEIYTNHSNFPEAGVKVQEADWIFEIPNPFPFKGSTFIDKEWADASAANPQRISLPQKPELSLNELLENENISTNLLEKLPTPLQLCLATTSTDARDLTALAELSCAIEKDAAGTPTGLSYRKDGQNRIRSIIHNHPLFEAVANNPALPDSYKQVMVLKPGAQGGSEIVGEFRDKSKAHVFEYLRRNSYIAGGHYAANMADDAVRYSIDSLGEMDMEGMRHLYYQRTFIRLAEQLDIKHNSPQKSLSVEELETLREKILTKINNDSSPEMSTTLWGWNFGFDYAPTGYRLHASHQQIHQQYSMLPQRVSKYKEDPLHSSETMASFGCGDMVAEVIREYRQTTGNDFFSDYLHCIHNNVRMDGHKEKESSLILWEDERAILFVPKAQTSQWELQLMTLPNSDGEAIGNIVEADTAVRKSLNRGIYLAQKGLAGLGAKMVTSIEYPKRLGRFGEKGQHLLYAFLPRLPESPGAFSEAQLRFINGHYPEDFAAVCRKQLASFL